jgi:hypothetical protein
VGHGVVEAEGLAEVAVENSPPVVKVLRVEWEVEFEPVLESGDIGGGGAFAEHLDDGVAGNNVDEKKNDRDHDPEDGERDEDAADGFGESCQLLVLSC